MEKRDVDDALLEAVRYGFLKNVNKCLADGADVNVRGEDNATPLYYAVSRGHNAIISVLLEHPDICVDCKCNAGITPLHEAILSYNLEVAILLIDHGASINERDVFEKTALHMAVTQNSETLVENLIYKGSDVNAMDSFYRTPLDIAILCTLNFRIAEILLRNGASPSPSFGQGLPLLSKAVLQANSEHHLEAIKLLVHHGADVNEKETVGKRTPLHIAAVTGYIPVVEYLLEQGADLFATNTSREMPVSIAILFKNWTVATLLTNAMEQITNDTASGETFSTSINNH